MGVVTAVLKCSLFLISFHTYNALAKTKVIRQILCCFIFQIRHWLARVLDPMKPYALNIFLDYGNKNVACCRLIGKVKPCLKDGLLVPVDLFCSFDGAEFYLYQLVHKSY